MILIQEYVSGNIVCKIVAIFSGLNVLQNWNVIGILSHYEIWWDRGMRQNFIKVQQMFVDKI